MWSPTMNHKVDREVSVFHLRCPLQVRKIESLRVEVGMPLRDVWITVPCLLCLVAISNADVIQLKSGGEVRGQLLDDAASLTEAETIDRPDEESVPIRMQTASGAVISIDRNEVDFVERRSAVVEEYVTRSRQMNSTVDSHWQLAEWCRGHLLEQQREEQLELLLAIDPEHSESRRILGYVKHNGKWMTRDGIMKKRGYVKYKNDWITPQELALIESDVSQRQAELKWYTKVRLWVGWLNSSDVGRQRKAVKEFEQIRDADAVPALSKLLGQNARTQVRMLYINVLAKIESRDAILGLVDCYLYDVHEPLRQAALSLIKADQTEYALPPLVSALGHASNNIVRRAAHGLGHLGDTSAVPALIDALVTTHRVSYTTKELKTGGGGLSISGGGISIGTGGSNISPELMGALRTGQVGFKPNPSQITTKVHTVSVPIKNAEVLVALEELTGRNLGFNERDWYLWWTVQRS